MELGLVERVGVEVVRRGVVGEYLQRVALVATGA
jgi:hypothetical protein